MAGEMTEPITRDTARAWSYLGDSVMGGVSEGQARYGEEAGKGFLRLTGDVRTENNGGFVQMRRDIAVPAGAQGIALRVRGNGERYFLHLRSSGLRMPWQFYQAPFETTPEWREIRVPFAAFRPKGGFQRRELRPETVQSLGIAAYGRAHRADVSLAALGFY
jgi:hypothetical protein